MRCFILFIFGILCTTQVFSSDTATNQIYKTIINGIPCYSKNVMSNTSEKFVLGKLSASLPAINPEVINRSNNSIKQKIIQRKITAHNNHIKSYQNRILKELLRTDMETNSLLKTKKKSLTQKIVIPTKTHLTQTALNCYSLLIQLEQEKISHLITKVTTSN